MLYLCTVHTVHCIDMCHMCMRFYVLLSAGLGLPSQHVDESWQSAEFFANKVGSIRIPMEYDIVMTQVC